MTNQATILTLKPCPFCGGEAEHDILQGFISLDSRVIENRNTVYCLSCPADVGECYSEHEDITPDELTKIVIEAWNRRFYIIGEMSIEKMGGTFQRPLNEDVMLCPKCRHVVYYTTEPDLEEGMPTSACPEKAVVHCPCCLTYIDQEHFKPYIKYDPTNPQIEAACQAIVKSIAADLSPHDIAKAALIAASGVES